MIIRKPYAFLIKNFKKVHIALLIIAIYIYYKTTQTYSFVNEFISLGVYDSFNEPISKYISFLAIICLILLILGSLSLTLLLKRKDKPWKLYLVPAVQYALLFIAFMSVRSFFKSYTGTELTTSIRAWKDLLLISQAVQFGIFIIFIIRIFGVDLNKFNFKMDEEYLELEQSDKEELEININIDKNAFKRVFKRTIRNLNYFYQEHKILSYIAMLIFLLVIGKNSLNYFNSHKSYKEGDIFDINGYTVKINNSYFSDKSYNGEIISSKSNFVVVDLTIKNNYQERKVNLDRFHVMNGISNYSPTEKTYETEFKDFGKAYDSLKLKRDKSQRLLLIYKVDKQLKSNKFVLYYQELDRNSKNLRKIKLKIKDLSNIKDKESLSLGETMTINDINEEENVTFEQFDILQEIEYTSRICKTSECSSQSSTYTAPNGYKILLLTFGSTNYEEKEMRNFVTDYGKIKYTDKNKKEKKINIEDALNHSYYGKYLYLQIPNEVAESNEISFEFTIRNNKYIYKLK